MVGRGMPPEIFKPSESGSESFEVLVAVILDRYLAKKLELLPQYPLFT